MNDALPPLLRARASVERALALAALSSPRLVEILGRERRASAGTLDAHTAAMLALDALQNQSDLTLLAPPAARLRMAQLIAAADADPPPGVWSRDLHLDTAVSMGAPAPKPPAVTLRARLYTPSGLVAPSPAILYFHGGGWVTGSIDTHHALCQSLAREARCRVVSLDYRLAPEHPFPAAVDDAVAAFRWLTARASSLDIDPRRIAVAGDSAGGNLSAVVSLKTRGEAFTPVLQALIYPAVDATRAHASHELFAEGYYLTRSLIDWFMGHTFREEHQRHPDVSPLFVPDLSGVPPALVYTAGFDPLRDEAHAYAERLRQTQALVKEREFPGLIHGFACTRALVPAARKACEEIAEDIRKELYRARE